MKPATTTLRPRPVKQKELLSFTNAAVKALVDQTASEEHAKSSKTTSKDVSFTQPNGSPSDLTFSSRDTSSSSDQRAVLRLGTELSSSSSLSGQGNGDKMDLSSLDSSFNTSTAVRVRVPSKMLREIRPPVDKSIEKGSASIKEPQPTPKVVRHVDGPSAWVSMSTSSPLHLPQHSMSTHSEQPTTTTTTIYRHEVIQVQDSDQENQKPAVNTQSSREIINRDIKQDTQSNNQVKKGHDGIGLSQGDPVTGLFTGNAVRPDSVKAKSFTLSQRERALKEDFRKGQDRRSAPIKRSVQPTIITSKETQVKPDKQEPKVDSQAIDNQVANAAAIAAAAASAVTAPILQVDARLRKLEELQQQLLNSQGSHINKRPVNPFIVPSSPSDLHEPAMGAASRTMTGYSQAFPDHYPSQVTTSHGTVANYQGVPGQQHQYQQYLHHYHQQEYQQQQQQQQQQQRQIPSHHHQQDGQQQQQRPLHQQHQIGSHHHRQDQQQQQQKQQHQQQHQLRSHHQQQDGQQQLHQQYQLGSHHHRQDEQHHQQQFLQQQQHLQHEQLQRQQHQGPSKHSFMSQLVQDKPFASPTWQTSQTSVPQPHVSQAGLQSQYSATSNSTRQAFMHQPMQGESYQQNPTTSSRQQQPVVHKTIDTHSTAGGTEGADRQAPVPSYIPAKHVQKQESTAKTKPVKNTKTQTSPQNSSLSSCDSPLLQTPRPRKKPPRPHIYSKELPTRERRVHFDQSVRYDPYLSYSKYAPSEYRDQRGHQIVAPAHHVVTAPTSIAPPPPRPILHAPREKAPDTGMEQVIDELGRMRSDIRTVLTETEKMKSGLNRQKIAHEMDMKFACREKEPSLLDTYLTKKVPQPTDMYKSQRITSPVVDNCADVKQILRDVETQRNNLEHNLETIVRQSEEASLYTFVDSMVQDAQGSEAVRIKQNIDKMIKEMTTAIKKEIDMESSKSQTKTEPPATTDQSKLKPKGKFQPGRKVPGKQSTLIGKQSRVGSGKENLPDTSKDKKPKATRPISTTKTTQKPVSKPVPKPVSKPISKPVSSSTNQTYLKSIYGRQPYHAHRTTSKAPYLHYQSPINPRTAALTAAILGPGHQYQSHPGELPQPIREISEKPKHNAWYYFNPAVDRSQVIPAGDGRVHVHAPLEGTKMPMAIPLGKPRTDPSLRLPLPSTSGIIEPAKQDVSPGPPAQSTPIQPSPKTSPTKPNVAVITIQHEGTEEESFRKTKKTSGGTKKRPDLAVQVLPQMDVDSLTESSESQILDISKPVTRPADIEYEDFRNYLAVKDTEPEHHVTDHDDEDMDDTPRIPTPENPLTLQGHTEKDHLYHGPPFPPEHPPLPSNTASGVLDADKRVSDAIEDRALEWVEQELLARIVSEMNRPLPDPTLVERPDPSPDSSATSDDGEVLAATIGLGGVQLFVDAGIPVDRDLVAVLIKDVIAEQIASTLGYPKPTASPRQPQVDIHQSPQTPEPALSPVTTPIPTPVYTPVQSEASEIDSPKVLTPDPTPTPSELSVTIETEEEPITPVKEEKEEPESEVSVVRSPVPTPVATPTGTQSPTVSVSTPEPSTREPDVTDVGLPVETPEPSVVEPSPKSASISTPTLLESSETTIPPTPPPREPTPPVEPSPSPTSASTLSPSTTSTITTMDEELSEGQLIQPYVHRGKYSEGEYAVSPGLVDLVKERNQSGDTMDMLGKDEDSRNELIRIALHGLLRRGLYSTSSLNTTGGISSTSTLRDADDIRQDSLNDYSQSEGEVVFPRDPVPVRRYDPGTVTSDASPRLRSNASPGELSPTVLRSNRKSSPGEIKTRSGGRRARSASPTGRRVITVAPSSPPGQRRQQTPNASRENSDSRSLHKSDLQHKHWEQPLNTSREGSPQRSPRDERQPSRGSDRQQSPPNHPSRGSDRQQSPPSHPNRGSDRQQSPPNQPSRGRDRQQSPPNQPSRSSDRQQTPPRSAGQRPVSRPPIHVPMPSMDQDDSSGYSRGERPGYDLGDTSGDVSPISGGDF